MADVPVMEKLDTMTPWHMLRTYPTAQEAMHFAYTCAQERKPAEVFPKYSVNGRVF